MPLCFETEAYSARQGKLSLLRPPRLGGESLIAPTPRHRADAVKFFLQFRARAQLIERLGD
jgi:hypothetical protein